MNVSESRSRLPATTEMETMIDRLLSEARRCGASSAEAGVSFDTGLTATVRLGEVETLEFTRDRSLGVTVYFGHRKGSASTSDWSDAALRDTVEAACAIARLTAEDPCAGLAQAERMARDVPDLDLSHPWPLTPEEAIERARVCESAARDLDTRIKNSEGATLATYSGVVAYGNSHGFVGAYPTTRHSLSCAVIAEDEGGMQRDYWYTVARDPHDLEAAEAVGQRAARRTVDRLGAKRLGTRQTPVIYAAELASGLLRHFVGAARGGKLYRKASFLLDHLNKPVFPEFVQIEEQPHLKKALGSAPFDGEGVTTTARHVVSDGVLKGYVLDAYSACRLGMDTTGNAGGVHNLSIRSGALSFEQLLREMGEGLLITELMGQGINYVTGDYSRGAAGYWVENGEIAYPVQEITVAGSLPAMFMGIREVATDVEVRGSIRSGSLLIDRMTVAGE